MRGNDSTLLCTLSSTFSHTSQLALRRKHTTGILSVGWASPLPLVALIREESEENRAECSGLPLITLVHLCCASKSLSICLWDPVPPARTKEELYRQKEREKASLMSPHFARVQAALFQSKIFIYQRV
jgi:hypothetical protein